MGPLSPPLTFCPSHTWSWDQQVDSQASGDEFHDVLAPCCVCVSAISPSTPHAPGSILGSRDATRSRQTLPALLLLAPSPPPTPCSPFSAPAAAAQPLNPGMLGSRQNLKRIPLDSSFILENPTLTYLI